MAATNSANSEEKKDFVALFESLGVGHLTQRVLLTALLYGNGRGGDLYEACQVSATWKRAVAKLALYAASHK
jgi:hypothetical protein